MTADLVVVEFSLEILERSILNDHSGELQFISLLTLDLKEYFRNFIPQMMLLSPYYFSHGVFSSFCHNLAPAV